MGYIQFQGRNIMSEEEYNEMITMLDNLKTDVIQHKQHSDSLDPTELLDKSLALVGTVIDYVERKKNL
jgi:hypothetical protein